MYYSHYICKLVVNAVQDIKHTVSGYMLNQQTKGKQKKIEPKTEPKTQHEIDHKAEQTLLWLFGISFLFHVAGCIVSVYFIENETKTSHLYSFYRTRVTGEKISTDLDGPKTSFVENLDLLYKGTCPNQPASIDSLLILQTSFDTGLGLENVMQTWMPTRYRLFALPYANGYWMLFVIFFLSSFFQIYFLCQVVCIDFFRRPCLARWLEYALTSPVQVVLIASCVMIRDVHTIMLLFVAQLVCVLLGFPLECAMQNPANDIQIAAKKTASTVNEKRPADWQDVAERLLVHPAQNEAATELLRYNKAASFTLWLLCFSASCIVHIVVWFVLIDQLSNVLHETRCYDGPREWKQPLQIVVYGQCVLFTLFAFVPIAQKIVMLKSPCADTFLNGSIAYAVLSVVAKTLLGGSYIAFVVLFPFQTKP